MTEIAIDARARIERYLGRVEEHIAGFAEEEREEILRDVDAHIRDALARRAPDGATAEDVVAVLDEMDPPASWGTGSPPKEAPAPPPAPPEPPWPPAPPPPAGRDILVPLLALSAILALLLAFAAAWISGRDAGGAPGLGLIAASLLGVSAVAVAIVRWNARVARESEESGRAMLGGASFVLLMAALGLVLVAIVALISLPSYPYSFYGQSYAEQMKIRENIDSIRDPHQVVCVAALICAGIAFLFAWILGRIAVAPAPDRPALTGWKRHRALIAPGIASAALLVGIFGAIPMMAFAIGLNEIFREHPDRIEFASATGFAALVLVGLLVTFGVLLRLAPGAIHAVFSPLTDRLKPRHWWAFLIAAGILPILCAGFLGMYLSATN